MRQCVRLVYNFGMEYWGLFFFGSSGRYVKRYTHLASNAIFFFVSESKISLRSKVSRDACEEGDIGIKDVFMKDNPLAK